MSAVQPPAGSEADSSHPGPPPPGAARPYNHWTQARLDELRGFYEAGAGLDEIAAAYDVRPKTVATLASRHGWRRDRRQVQRWALHEVLARKRAMAAAQGSAASSSSLPVSHEERRFNHRLSDIIRAYWHARGRLVTVTLREQPGGLLGIRSDCVNGTPPRLAPPREDEAQA